MFEEEAEERITEQYGTSGEYITRQRIWQDGAEFGYNKANEEIKQNGLALQSDMDKTIEQNIALKKELEKANKWHFVKDGLPEKRKYVLIYTNVENVYIARLVKDNYFIIKRGGFVHTSAVIAWKEIVLPELEESE